MRKKALIITYRKLKQSKTNFNNKNTVLVGGCYDLIHFGHLQFLKKSKEEGNYLIVALESDEFIKKNKRKAPIHNQEERAEILANLNMVDMVVILPYFSDGRDYVNLVKEINPKVIAVTEGDPQYENKKSQAKMVGGKLKIVVPLLKNFSTRKIINDIG